MTAKTYTIALAGDTLLATAPDDDHATMAERLDDAFTAIGVPKDEREVYARDNVTMLYGLRLLRDEDEIEAAEEAGAEVVYSGTDMGWLEDDRGQMAYEAAARFPVNT